MNGKGEYIKCSQVNTHLNDILFLYLYIHSFFAYSSLQFLLVSFFIFSSNILKDKITTTKNNGLGKRGGRIQMIHSYEIWYFISRTLFIAILFVAFHFQLHRPIDGYIQRALYCLPIVEMNLKILKSTHVCIVRTTFWYLLFYKPVDSVSKSKKYIRKKKYKFDWEPLNILLRESAMIYSVAFHFFLLLSFVNCIQYFSIRSNNHTQLWLNFVLIADAHALSISANY